MDQWRSHRRHVACKAPLHCAAFSGSAALRSKRRAGSLRPSLAVSVEPRAPSDPARLLPRVCLHPLMRVQWVCPAGTQRARCSRTPCAPAAALGCCCPHPRIARIVCALNNRCRARSRGFRRPSDITRSYAQASCLSGAARGVLPRESLRARVTRRYVKWPPARPCTCCGAALPARHCSSVLHALRASARHPWLARLAAACRCCARAGCCGSGQAVAARRRARHPDRFVLVARWCRHRLAPCSPPQCRARLRGSLREH